MEQLPLLAGDGSSQLVVTAYSHGERRCSAVKRFSVAAIRYCRIPVLFVAAIVVGAVIAFGMGKNYEAERTILQTCSKSLDFSEVVETTPPLCEWGAPGTSCTYRCDSSSCTWDGFSGCGSKCRNANILNCNKWPCCEDWCRHNWHPWEHKCTHIHTHTPVQVRAHTHTHTHTHAHTHTHTRARAHTMQCR